MIDETGAVIIQDQPERGVVPNNLEYEYEFLGQHGLITDRFTGVAVHLDFSFEKAEWFTVGHFADYLGSLRRPDFPEQRLIELHPQLDTLPIAFDELLAAGLLQQPTDRPGVFEFASDCNVLWSEIVYTDLDWEDDATQDRAAACLGDWEYLAQFEDWPSRVATIVRNRAAGVREVRQAQLTSLFDSPETRRVALLGLSNLDSPLLGKFIERALNDELPNNTTLAAVEIVKSRPTEDWQRQVYDLFKALQAGEDFDPPRSVIWCTCAGYLLQHNYRVEEVWQAIDNSPNGALFEVALLALEFAPARSREWFRRALRSISLFQRTDAAAALLILDQPFCVDDLTAVLEESNDHAATFTCREALLAHRRPDLQRIAEEWEQRHSGNQESQRFANEETRLRAIRMFDDAVTRLHDRVWPLRPQAATIKG
jgi:hypothetical protein